MAGDFRFVRQTQNIMVQLFGGFESAIYTAKRNDLFWLTIFELKNSEN